MQKVLSAEEMREVDRLTTERYGIPSILLMENAAHAAARVITEKLGGSVKGRSFLILCGKGNNGGDGAALGRILWNQGAKVNIYLFGRVEDTKGDARVNFEIAQKLCDEGFFLWDMNYFYFHEDKSYKEFWESTKNFREDVCIDALFGTGLTRKVEGELEKVISGINHHIPHGRNSFIVSIDLPSGVNADRAFYSTVVGGKENADYSDTAAHPDLTITFTAPKIANVLPPVSRASKEFVTVNIGSPEELIEESPSKLFLAEKNDAKLWLGNTWFTENSYKNKRGHALLVAGSSNYAGAAVLAGNAAIVSGVGLVTIATARSAQNSIASRVLAEVMTRGVAETENGAASAEAFDEINEFIEKSIDAVEVGSGLSSSEESTRRLVKRLVEERRTPVVIDADGLNALAPFELKGSDELPLVLTPHEGEFLKLLGTKDKEAIEDRVAVVREFAVKHHVILVLKGERALIAAPDGRVVINPTGNSGLGKAGNGDTLAGIITGFAAQAAQMKIDMFETVVAAVYLAGLAGDIAAEKYGKRSMLASDVRECLMDAFLSITD